jgi:hypothetical protein
MALDTLASRSLDPNFPEPAFALAQEGIEFYRTLAAGRLEPFQAALGTALLNHSSLAYYYCVIS